MSTSIKRIALVAVAALGLGVVSVAPSTAAQSAAQSYIYCSQADGGAISNTTTTGATCGGIAGTSNFVTLTGVQTAKDVELTVTGGKFVTSTSGFVTNGDATVALAAAANAGGTIKVATPAAGTITVSVKYATAGSGIFTASTETVVITVSASALSGTYSSAKSSVYLVAGETWTATADATTAPTKVSTYVAGDSATASIVVSYLDGLGKAVTGDSITATITSGPGTILTAATNGKFDTTTALAGSVSSTQSVGKYTASADVDASTGVAAFFVFANGQVGTSVVTIKNSAGTVLGSKSVTFTSTTVASIEATVVKATVQGDSTGATGGVIKLVLKDAAGNAMTAPSAYPTAKSSDSTIATATQSVSGYDTATVGSSGDVYWGITPAAAGKYGPVTITFTVGTVTATATVTLSSAVAATATVADVAVGAGDSIAYAVTLKDANGYAVPEGIAASNYITSIASTGGIATEVSTTSVTTKAGVLTLKGTAPLVSTTIATTITLTGTAGTANSYLAKTLTGTTLTPKATVSNAATDAAIDAATEASAAAQDATDAALAAAEAADGATAKAQEAVDAVADLAAQVDTLIKALKSQIKTLSNLVAKIAKKIKA